MRLALTVDPEIPVPPVHYGGIERIVDMLARNLANRGHEVTLFAHPQSACPVRLVGWPGKNSLSKADTARNAATLAYHAGRSGFDLIHSFSRVAYLAALLPLAIPKLMSYQRDISVLTTGAACRLSRGTLEFSAISLQMMSRNKLKGLWHLVPNGVPLSTYTFVGNVPADAPLVFLGRVEEIKGPHLAIEVARRAQRKLIIAGNIPAAHQNWYKTSVAPSVDNEAVTYIGPVDDQQKNNLLGKAFAFLMPILWEEPFGIVMAEAMACGTPVIALRRGAVPEVVEDGVSGFVCANVDEMVRAVAKCDLIDRSHCRSRVEKLYSEDAIADAYLEIYASMINRIRKAA